MIKIITISTVLIITLTMMACHNEHIQKPAGEPIVPPAPSAPSDTLVVLPTNLEPAVEDNIAGVFINHNAFTIRKPTLSDWENFEGDFGEISTFNLHEVTDEALLELVSNTMFELAAVSSGFRCLAYHYTWIASCSVSDDADPGEYFNYLYGSPEFFRLSPNSHLTALIAGEYFDANTAFNILYDANNFLRKFIDISEDIPAEYLVEGDYPNTMSELQWSNSVDAYSVESREFRSIRFDLSEEDIQDFGEQSQFFIRRETLVLSNNYPEEGTVSFDYSSLGEAVEDSSQAMMNFALGYSVRYQGTYKVSDLDLYRQWSLQYHSECTFLCLGLVEWLWADLGFDNTMSYEYRSSFIDVTLPFEEGQESQKSITYTLQAPLVFEKVLRNNASKSAEPGSNYMLKLSNGANQACVLYEPNALAERYSNRKAYGIGGKLKHIDRNCDGLSDNPAI